MSIAPPHLALITSPERFREEGRGARRQAAAVLAEGAIVTLLEPEAERDPDVTQPARTRPERRTEFPQRLRYAARVPFWQRRARLDRLALGLERAPPDLLWCCGADAWSLAIALGDELDRPVVLEFRRADELRAAAKAVRSDRVVAVAAPCEALARAARQVLPAALVRCVPMGVRVPDEPDEESRSGASSRNPVVAVLGEGRDAASFVAALRAVRAAAERHPSLMALVEFRAALETTLWRQARALGLLERVTAIERGRIVGASVEACDVLLLPEARGGPRVEALAALGRCVPVISVADPMADTLFDGETAVIITRAGDARPWTDALVAALDHPLEARRLAKRGRQLVWMHHRSTISAQALVATATQLVHEGVLPIAAARNTSRHAPPEGVP